MIKIFNRGASGASIPRIDTALFLFLNLLLFALIKLSYNLYAIFKYTSSPLASDIAACLVIMSLAFLWSLAFLGWLKYAGLKNRFHAVIGFLFAILLSLKSLGVLLILKESPIVPSIVTPALLLSLKLACAYLVVLILWQGVRDKAPLDALFADKRYLRVFMLAGLFYILSLLSGPGHLSSSERFALSAAEKYHAEVKKTEPRRTAAFQKDIDFYERMYALGRLDAAASLGIFYEASGDLRAAEEWYSKAARLTEKNAGDEKGTDSGLSEEAGLALQRYRAQALAGKASAIFLYATLLDMRSGTTDPDVLPWYEQAAELGHKGAAGILADYYWAGKNTKSNLGKACHWGVRLPLETIRGLRYRTLCALFNKTEV